MRCSTKLSYLGTAVDCIGRKDAGVRGILSRNEASARLGVDGGRDCGGDRHTGIAATSHFPRSTARIPAGIAIIVVGAGLVIGAWVHGMALDGQRVQPGKISGSYSGPNVGGGLSGGRRIGLFKGNLLWGASFYEEAGFAEVKRAWHSGAWLQDHRMFRATLVLIGAPILLVGAFGTGALAIDVTAVRLLLLLSLVYALARLSFALARA